MAARVSHPVVEAELTCPAVAIDLSSPQAKCMRDTIGERAFWRWRISNYVNRHANQGALQRIVGMPWRELGDGTKGKHHHAEKQQHGVNG